ncbi:MAG: AMP-binding protein [Pseudomonadota bacterium]
MAEPKTIGEIVHFNAQKFGERIAFQDDDRSVSFEAFADRVSALCAGLEHLGVQPGDRIAVLSKNRIESLEIFMAADTGAIIVPINWRLKPDEIRYILDDCSPQIFMADARYADETGDVVDATPSIRHRFMIGGAPKTDWRDYENELIKAGKPGQRTQLSISPQAAACIVYTSGTTGRPKGAILSHSALISSCKRIAQEMLKLDETDTTIAVMPLFHVGGMWFHCFPSFAMGAKTLIQSQFSPEQVLTAISEHQVTNIHLAPTMVADLLDRPETAQAARSLARIFYAASPMPMATLKRAMAQFPNSAFFQSYGSTEAGPICWLSPDDHALAIDHREGLLQSCGKPFEDVNVRLMRVDGTECLANEIGEIHVSSSGTMSAYWQNPAATASTKKDSWIATGDLGRYDDDGFLYIADRKSHMIITGGENVYPIEVENALMEIDGIVEAAVIGVSDERWVERVVACIVLTDGMDISAADIIDHTKGKLSGYKCPKEVCFLETLPKNAAGKILKKQLKATYPFRDGRTF